MSTTMSATNGATMQLDVAVKPLEPAPRSLGPYEFKKMLGRGAMGEVFLALHVKLDRRVALKVLPASLVANCTSVERFKQEMKAVGRLDHPNVVRAFDADDFEGHHYIAMEYVEGRDLQQVLDESGRQTASVVCDLISQAAAGLQHIHENDLVHRDIKPSNLMLTDDGVLKILDLGIAKLCDSKNGALTQVGTYFGTPDYISPEQIATTADVDIRSDIYSLGCTAYQLLTGIPPYGGSEYETHHAKLIGHTKGSPLPVHRRLSTCPKGLSRVISRMMAVRPEDRYQQPIEVAEALKEWADSRQSERESGNTELGLLRKLTTHHGLRKRLTAGVFAGLALLVVASFFAMPSLLSGKPEVRPEIQANAFAGDTDRGLPNAHHVSGVEAGVRGIEANTGELRDTLLRIESSMLTLADTKNASTLADEISGTYRVEGTEPNGKTYTGTAMIIRRHKHYDVQWWYGDDSESGRGILQGNSFIVHWGEGAPAIYERQQDGRLDGTFDNGAGQEVLIPAALSETK